jgi:YVTN family beta-propeller protein
MQMKILHGYLFISLLLVFGSCSDNTESTDSDGTYVGGFFITNEGPFNNGTGTITHVSEEGIANQDVYKSENNADLGNIVQSMHLAGDKAYIVVNNSNKVVVAERNTMKTITEIKGINVMSPRYFVSYNGKGFLSNWGDPNNPSDDFISVIDLTSDQVLTTIPVGEGPENMLVRNNFLYVNLEGGYGHNNKLAVIDTKELKVVKNLTLGDAPNSLKEDLAGNTWVLCGGKPAWTGMETGGKLVKISSDNEVITSLDFEFSEHPQHLTILNDAIFYNLGNQVFKMSTSDRTLPKVPFKGIVGSFYFMTGHEGEIFATDAKDYQSEGNLYIYSAANGTLLKTFRTGIIPGWIAFQD